mmetsp:Transcript_1608/g.3087  ORF Transcript_1608/g.3087 Transcript_1608/m.3087 type:complete len:206 (-) Transcript_1608:768-1385(-)
MIIALPLPQTMSPVNSASRPMHVLPLSSLSIRSEGSKVFTGTTQTGHRSTNNNPRLSIFGRSCNPGPVPLCNDSFLCHQKHGIPQVFELQTVFQIPGTVETVDNESVESRRLVAHLVENNVKTTHVSRMRTENAPPRFVQNLGTPLIHLGRLLGWHAGGRRARGRRRKRRHKLHPLDLGICHLDLGICQLHGFPPLRNLAISGKN